MNDGAVWQLGDVVDPNSLAVSGDLATPGLDLFYAQSGVVAGTRWAPFPLKPRIIRAPVEGTRLARERGARTRQGERCSNEYRPMSPLASGYPGADARLDPQNSPPVDRRPRARSGSRTSAFMTGIYRVSWQIAIVPRGYGELPGPRGCRLLTYRRASSASLGNGVTRQIRRPSTSN